MGSEALSAQRLPPCAVSCKRVGTLPSLALLISTRRKCAAMVRPLRTLLRMPALRMEADHIRCLMHTLWLTQPVPHFHPPQLLLLLLLLLSPYDSSSGMGHRHVWCREALPILGVSEAEFADLAELL